MRSVPPLSVCRSGSDPGYTHQSDSRTVHTGEVAGHAGWSQPQRQESRGSAESRVGLDFLISGVEDSGSLISHLLLHAER
jgi:hypothetical protein